MKVSRKFTILCVGYAVFAAILLWYSQSLLKPLNRRTTQNPTPPTTDRLEKPPPLQLQYGAEIRATRLSSDVNETVADDHKNTSATGKGPDAHATTHPACEPYHQIVFVKTHKTASTTANTIVQRYGLEHNLTFAIPAKRGKFSLTAHFSRKMVATSRSRKSRRGKISLPAYNVIANHARFNKPEMDAVVPHARYFTILRDPVTRFESVFGYYSMATRLKLKGSIPVRQFFEKPDFYFNKKPFMYQQLKNGMIFTLGLNHVYHDDEAKVDSKIHEIEKEFDLVLLSEYFDESLLLMKKILCWDEDDIFYLPKGIRPEKRRYVIDDDLKEKILKWNAADVKLYAHLNRTFWQKIEEYGPTFESDLARFRERQRALYTQCIDPTKVNTRRDPREQFLVLRKNASKLCEVLMRRVDYFVSRYRDRQWT